MVSVCTHMYAKHAHTRTHTLAHTHTHKSIILFAFIYFPQVGGGKGVTCQSENSFWELVLIHCHVDPKDQTQAVGFGGSHFSHQAILLAHVKALP